MRPRCRWDEADSTFSDLVTPVPDLVVMHKAAYGHDNRCLSFFVCSAAVDAEQAAKPLRELHKLERDRRRVAARRVNVNVDEVEFKAPNSINCMIMCREPPWALHVSKEGICISASLTVAWGDILAVEADSPEERLRDYKAARSMERCMAECMMHCAARCVLGMCVGDAAYYVQYESDRPPDDHFARCRLVRIVPRTEAVGERWAKKLAQQQPCAQGIHLSPSPSLGRANCLVFSGSDVQSDLDEVIGVICKYFRAAQK